MICRTCGTNPLTLFKVMEIAEKERTELTALRAWKEKARPLLEIEYRRLDAILQSRSIEQYHDITKKLTADYEELTELLKED